MALPTKEAAEETRKFIKQAGGDSTWDRLAEYLGDKEGKDQFVINRSFRAPLEKVFAAWRDPAQLIQWSGPTGAAMEILRGTIEAGSEMHWRMGGPNGPMYGCTRYLAIEPPTKIVYTQQFRDEQGGISRHPLLPTWPETMLTTVSFHDEGEGFTRVTLVWEPYGEASAEARKVFRGMRPGMTGGWTGSFDKLEEFLAD